MQGYGGILSVGTGARGDCNIRCSGCSMHEREAGSRKKLAQHARGASQTKLRALSSLLCARRMHGDGVYVDAAGETWKGTWFNGNGPELLNVQ